MRCVDCEYLKRIQKPIRFGKDIFDTGMVECTKHDLVMEYTSTRALNKRTCVEEQTDTEIAKAIVHKMIDDAVIASDAYPDLRQKMHDAVDEYEPQTERSE